MALKSSRVVSSSSCPVTTTRPVTISCPAPTAVSPIEVSPTVFPTIGADVNALLTQLGLSPNGEAVSPVSVPTNNPCVQPGGVNPLAALIANNPAAALAVLSPALAMFNLAINPNAGPQAFNPADAPTQGLANKQCKQGKANFPFGKFFKKPNCWSCFRKPDFDKFCEKPFGI